MPLLKSSKRIRSDSAGKGSSVNDFRNSVYYESYGNLSVHSLMLRDKPRVETYARALAQSKSAIEGKIVVDVGSGTGILSMLCAKQCNPKHVYAIEANTYIADLSRMIIEQNGLQDTITVINKPVEEVDFNDWKHADEKADVVISEWMGFYLVHEAMLDSVLWARDFLCNPNPLLLPSHCKIWAAVMSNEKFRNEELEVWGTPMLCGIDMSAIGMARAVELTSSPQIEILEPSQLLSNPQVAFELDLNTIDRLSFSTMPMKRDMCLKTEKEGIFSSIGLWFEVSFQGTDVVLDSSPFSAPTHWKQTNVFLGCWAAVPAGISIDFSLTITRPDPTERQYTITIET
jgi:protein arginine N-methyltransferase 1